MNTRLVSFCGSPVVCGLLCVGLIHAVGAVARSQGLDLVPHTPADAFRTATGPGLSLPDGALSLFTNPAALATPARISVDVLTSFGYRKTTLSLQTPDLPSASIIDRGSMFQFDGAGMGVPLGSGLALGVAVSRRVGLAAHNTLRAITRSILFTHDTEGSLWGVSAGGSYDAGGGMSGGLAIVGLSGSIESRLQGDNHGLDAGKRSLLRSACTGVGAAFGLRGTFGRWDVGIAGDLPVALSIATFKEVSADSAYAQRFPAYDTYTWRLPGAVRAALAYDLAGRLRLSAGFEYRSFHSSDVQFALYEYEGRPVWGRVVSISAGAALAPQILGIPLRLSIARLPQVFSSERASGADLSNVMVLLDSSPSSRVVRMVYSAATSGRVSFFSVEAGVSYSSASWSRDVVGTAAAKQSIEESVLSFFLCVRVSDAVPGPSSHVD